MKVRIFSGTPGEVEQELNEWSRRNPNAEVKFAMQTEFAQEITVTILFHPSGADEDNFVAEGGNVVFSANTK